ncbi:Tim44/TimA family putative adaptor protein [Acuticoccus sp. M5D2P5]|uniref:Tim44/TimA family putative adaptor protein n=1 Tax=Acuticoccus kalidii TaxID=2910977 RepID=UPI001F3E8FBC|nr:Tim44/TimA family putative adaptor protein [Acuticoccus kalidii]MCF3933659.1 Tim44/TimA family putative adaptor protein [Acuticoccus kalidii]
MSDFFDIYNLMILALAVAIFLRLRSVLGRRTGNERPPYDPYAAKSGEQRSRETSRDNVVTLPRQPSAESAGGGAPPDVEARITPVAAKGTPLYDALHDIISADPSFEPKRFLEGASMAYEMVVTAFATGDRDTLRPLLSPEVFDGFDAAITERERSGQSMSTTLIGIEKIAISDASLKGDAVRVTVRIESEMITATYDKAGELVDGDPNKVVDVVDVWTFERRVTSPDPNWALVATESA